MRDPETNELYYIDYSKNNVYDTLTRPFQTILRNVQEGIEDEEILLKGFAEGVAQAAGQIAEPFVSESMFTEVCPMVVPLTITLSTVSVVRVPRLVIFDCAAPVTVAAVPEAFPVTLPVNAPAKAVAVNVPELGL